MHSPGLDRAAMLTLILAPSVILGGALYVSAVRVAKSQSAGGVMWAPRLALLGTLLVTVGLSSLISRVAAVLAVFDGTAPAPRDAATFSSTISELFTTPGVCALAGLLSWTVSLTLVLRSGLSRS
jgi:hypothetical protein